MMDIDHKWMKLAFLQAYRCKGFTGKNPNVGCVLVKDGNLICSSNTSISGRPHAEENLINLVKNKDLLKNSSLYLTLEPCAHKGKNNLSCTDLILKSGITNVYISSIDPDPRTSGKSVSILKNAGLHVQTGLLEEEGNRLNAGFFSRIKYNKPIITLKIAISLDGKIALKNKFSKWISNDLSLRYSHFLRSQSDAIMTSSNNVLFDNPELTCRIDGLEKKSPLKIIIDRNLKLQKKFKIFKSFYGEKTLIYYFSSNLKHKKISLNKFSNVTFRDLETINFDKENFWNNLLHDIANLGVNYLLVESGPNFIFDLINSNLIDEIAMFRSNKIIGNDGIPFVEKMNMINFFDVLKYKLVDYKILHDDVFELRTLVR